MKILLTSTSFQDTPGQHQDELYNQDFEIDTLRGPVKEEVLLPIIHKYDGIICGDDEVTQKVIEKGVNGKLRVISKYGVGLDKIDLEAAEWLGMPVYNTPGVNHITVAEHTIAMILTYLKNIHKEYNYTKEGEWIRLIGNEVYGKRVGIVGLGKIGKEVVKRIKSFGVELFAFDIQYSKEFVQEHNINWTNSITELFQNSDIISLHMPLNDETRHIINKEVLSAFSSPKILVNTSRALLVQQDILIENLKNGKIEAYLTDVMDEEPMPEEHPLRFLNNVLITPHIGSRTYQSVERQGIMAVNNLLKILKNQ